MSGPGKKSLKPITCKSDLIAWFAQGEAAAGKKLIGIEHEKPPFYLADNAPVAFNGVAGRKGIADFIDAMIADNGWDPGALENGAIVDIRKNNVSWTFEPGLQMETGGAPLRSVHHTARETDRVLKEAIEICDDLGIGMLAMGYHPTHDGQSLPRMPKSRYAMIRSYTKARGFTSAADMMACTSTVQVNLGYGSEAEMVKMLRVSLALQPVAVALFATSPFALKADTGIQSYRSHIIRNNMGGRYGFMLPIAFDEGFGYEMFVDYALNTMPLMGVYRGNAFLDAGGRPFQDFIDGTLPAAPGHKATLADWQNHLNTIWSEVRMRRFLEMRGADNGPAEMIKALPAFWAGLLYDPQALDDAYEMIRDWTSEDRDYLRAEAPVSGLQTAFMGASLQDVARNALALSQAGLRRRGLLDAKGNDESVYLEPLHAIAESGQNWAQRLQRRFDGEWNRDISHVFAAMNYAAEPSVLRAAALKPATAARGLNRR